MTCRKSTFTFISRLILSCFALFFLCKPSALEAKTFGLEKDTIPLFRGFAVSFDIVGPILQMLSDYGDFEASLRVNLHDQYFPTVEVGYGRANSESVITGLCYKTGGSFFRIGCDLNILKNKHAPNRLLAGVRYGYNNSSVDISHPTLIDPVWGKESPFSISNERCWQHWIEVVLGLDAKVWGPLHMGWIFRYKFRLSKSDTSIGPMWYIPGFGKAGTTNLGATYNITIDI